MFNTIVKRRTKGQTMTHKTLQRNKQDRATRISLKTGKGLSCIVGISLTLGKHMYDGIISLR